MAQKISLPKFRRLDRITWASGGTYRADLIKDFGLKKPVRAIRFRYAFTITATGGGTVSGLTQDASIQSAFSRLIIEGHHKTLGTVKLVDMAANALTHLWHLINDMLGTEQDFSDPAPTVSATGDGRREFTIPFTSDFMVVPFASYLDPRDFTQIQLDITHGLTADYAATNLSSVTNATIDIEVDEIEEGLPENNPHFVPKYQSIPYVIGATTNTDIIVPGHRTGGFVPLVSVKPHDDSATGNSQRNAPGLLRRLSLKYGTVYLIDKGVYVEMIRDGERNFRLAFTTTRRDGPITILFDRDRTGNGFLDNKNEDLNWILDTSSAVQQGTTAVTAAANDRADFVYIVLMPNAQLRDRLRAAGVAA